MTSLTAGMQQLVEEKSVWITAAGMIMTMSTILRFSFKVTVEELIQLMVTTIVQEQMFVLDLKGMALKF